MAMCCEEEDSQLEDWDNSLPYGGMDFSGIDLMTEELPPHRSSQSSIVSAVSVIPRSHSDFGKSHQLQRGPSAASFGAPSGVKTPRREEITVDRRQAMQMAKQEAAARAEAAHDMPARPLPLSQIAAAQLGGQVSSDVGGNTATWGSPSQLRAASPPSSRRISVASPVSLVQQQQAQQSQGVHTPRCNSMHSVNSMANVPRSNSIASIPLRRDVSFVYSGTTADGHSPSRNNSPAPIARRASSFVSSPVQTQSLAAIAAAAVAPVGSGPPGAPAPGAASPPQSPRAVTPRTVSRAPSHHGFISPRPRQPSFDVPSSSIGPVDGTRGLLQGSISFDVPRSPSTVSIASVNPSLPTGAGGSGPGSPEVGSAVHGGSSPAPATRGIHFWRLPSSTAVQGTSPSRPPGDEFDTQGIGSFHRSLSRCGSFESPLMAAEAAAARYDEIEGAAKRSSLLAQGPSAPSLHPPRLTHGGGPVGGGKENAAPARKPLGCGLPKAVFWKPPSEAQRICDEMRSLSFASNNSAPGPMLRGGSAAQPTPRLSAPQQSPRGPAPQQMQRGVAPQQTPMGVAPQSPRGGPLLAWPGGLVTGGAPQGGGAPMRTARRSSPPPRTAFKV
eukprot:TRINITY_DN70064_c0_g1_i1.p1 TRINITY_DN70064_c0_g1~~TRINITY_DN70064_c0_g1_i1.p1  ORF type:complete len:612 (-),score=85.19 TRINITY_DN70064_c0_g1_i1:50-1885(-)